MAQIRRNRAHWRRLVDGWLSSGLTQQKYCERHGLSVGSLQRWRRIFRDQGSTAQAGTTATVNNHPSVQLLPVKLITNGCEATKPLTLRLPDGLSIEIASDFDASALKRLLALLREAA